MGLYLSSLVLGLLLLVLWSVRGWIFGTNHSGKNQTSKSGKKLPPGPVPLPIVGSLFELGSKPHESLARLAKTYGPVMTMKLGTLTAVVVSSASAAKEVLQIHDNVLASRTVKDAVKVLNHHMGSLVWLPPASQWRDLRKLCNNHVFTPHRLGASETLRRQKVRELIAYVGEIAQVGQALDIGELAFTTTLNLLSNTVFSVDLAGTNSKTAQEFKAMMWGLMEEVGRPNLSDYFPYLRPLDPQGIRRRITVYMGNLYKLIDEMVDQRLNSIASDSASTTNNDLLDVLLDHYRANSAEFGRHEIRALLGDIFAAGTDTTSTTLEWAMAELLRNPDSMAKLKSEIQENIDEGRPVEETDVARLPYLQAVVKETLRLHPPVPLLVPHRAEIDVEICGFTVPKDAQVLVNTWAIVRDPGLWKNPDLFVPERFLGVSAIDVIGHDFELIPFGSGRRICPGMTLALRMLHLMLASLLQSFDWKIEGGISPKELDVTDKFGITLKKALPLRAIPVEPKPRS